MMGRSTRRSQRGATLMVALVMLVMMTLIAMSSFHMGKGSLEVVGNMQHRGQAMAAAQGVIEEAISTTRFFESPDDVFVVACAGPNTRCADIDGNGADDITVALDPPPMCVTARPIANAALDLAVADDAACSIGASQNFGVAGAVSGNSLCANSIWEINARATDAVTQTEATVTQGVAVRVSTDNIAASCP